MVSEGEIGRDRLFHLLFLLCK